MIAILYLIAIVVATNLFVVWLRINAGKKIANNATPFLHANSNASIKVLFIGDSTAIGTGVKSPKDSIAGRFFKDHPHSEIINLGKNGLRTKKLIPILERQKNKYNLVVVQVGGNDILGFVDIKELKNEISRALQLSKKLSRNIVLLTSGNVGSAPFFPKPLGYFYTKKTLEVRKLFKNEARENGAIYIDLFKERDKDEFLKDPKKYFAKDMLHPSSDGYGLWYQEFKKTLEENKLRF